MQLLEIIAIAGASSLVLFTIIYNIVRKKQGKSGCSCTSDKCSGNCGNSYSESCSDKKPNEK